MSDDFIKCNIDINDVKTWDICQVNMETGLLMVDYSEYDKPMSFCYGVMDWAEESGRQVKDHACFDTPKKLFDTIKSKYGFSTDDFVRSPYL